MRYGRLAFRVTIAAVVAAASGLAVLPQAAAASTGINATTATVVRRPAPPTAGGYGVDITIAYDTNAPTTQWRMEFDLAPNSIPNPWSGYAFSNTGNHWTLNYSADTPQRAGTTFTLNFTIFGTTDMQNCRIGAIACVYLVQTDPVPPTTPTNPTATRFSGTSPWGPYATIYLTWGASTDNYRLSGYEVAANGQVVASLDTTKTYLHMTYTTAQVTYTVRALDYVGNYSAPATVVLPAI